MNYPSTPVGGVDPNCLHYGNVTAYRPFTDCTRDHIYCNDCKSWLPQDDHDA